MRAALACALLWTALPASADGPALAHLTVAGTTMTLTELAPVERGQPMSFAQMHLGFPLPPVLHVSVSETDGATQVQHISLNTLSGTSDGMGTPLGPETFLWFPPENTIATATEQEVRIEADALSRTPLGQFSVRPVLIEIQLTSP